MKPNMVMLCSKKRPTVGAWRRDPLILFHCGISRNAFHPPPIPCSMKREQVIFGPKPSAHGLTTLQACRMLKRC
ncbi:MAG: hypothetical protein FD149_1945 [Rhodospirillaceae bacterium]|nr:MAG: hypothetical protein FD149_1945 [Rhodospirillaceae bacterium]